MHPLVGRRELVSGGAALLALAACSRAPGQGATGRLRIATGNRGAVFDRYGAALAQEAAVRMPAVEPEVVRSRGSIDNVRLVLGGRAEVGFCLGDTARRAFEGDLGLDGRADLVAVTRLYDSFLQVLVPRRSRIRTVADLGGRRVAAGQVGSGTRLVVERCLAAAGRPADADRLVDLPLATAVVALETGRVDALAFVSGFPVPSLVDLGERLPLRALDLGGLFPTLSARPGGEDYVAGPLPAAPYGLPEAVQTVSVKTSMLTRRDLPDDLVAGFASVIYDRQTALARRAPDVRQPTLAAAVFTQPIPLHPGSMTYLRRRYAAGG